MGKRTTATVVAGTCFPAILLFILCNAGATSVLADSPVFSRVLKERDACEGVECGRGTCKAINDSVIPFACECMQGWTQLFQAEAFQFLPCVIPNCTVDLYCAHPTPPTLAPVPPTFPSSLFDPCTYTYCGEGSCVRTSGLGHRCHCREGYANLLNVTIFPCFSECFLKADCSSVGFGLRNQSSQTPALASSPASSKGWSRSIHPIIIPLLLGAMILEM